MDWDNLRDFLELSRAGKLTAAYRLGWATLQWSVGCKRWRKPWIGVVHQVVEDGVGQARPGS